MYHTPLEMDSQLRLRKPCEYQAHSSQLSLLCLVGFKPRNRNKVGELGATVPRVYRWREGGLQSQLAIRRLLLLLVRAVVAERKKAASLHRLLASQPIEPI